MTMFARLEAADAQQGWRSCSRRLLKLRVLGSISEQAAGDVLIHDLSLSGLLIETSEGLPIGASVEVELPEAGKALALVVWSTGRYYGCQFEVPISAAVLSAALLKSPNERTPKPRTPIPSPLIEWEAEEGSQDRLPLANRLRVIAALAAAAWVAVLTPVLVISRIFA